MAQNRLPQQHEYQHLGTYLRDLREHFALDVAEVARRTHIRAKYIQAIEDEQLDALPGKVYARGYVVTYAEFFNLAAEDFANQYMAQFAAGQAVPAKEVHYFVPEPKRQQIERRASMKWPVLGMLVIVAIGGGYVLMPPSAEVPQSEVMDVPERLVEQLRTSAMATAENLDCLMGTAALSCLDSQRQAPQALFVRLPAMMYVERDTPAFEQEEAKTIENGLMVDEDAVEAQEEAGDDTAVTAQDTPAAAKPAPVVAPKAPSKPAPVETKAEPKAAIPADAPFKRQGEEDTPETNAEPKPQETEQPAAAEPAAEAAPRKGLLSGEWFEEGLPQGYQDPNAPREDMWSPRGRR